MVADRNHGNLRRVKLANDRHVAKHVGVAGMINLHPVGKLDHVAAGLAAVNDLVAVRNAARVVGVHHGDLDVAHGLRAAFVHARNLLYALLFQPVSKLGNGHDRGIMLLGDFNRIADVVEVAVGAEQDIHFLDVLLVLRALGIAHDPRVDDDDLAGWSFNAKGRMAEPGKFDSVQVHDLWLRQFASAFEQIQRRKCGQTPNSRALV